MESKIHRRRKTWTHLGLHDSQQIPALAVVKKSRHSFRGGAPPSTVDSERGILIGGVNWQKVL
jgi:hypothetical protein